jgi:hypothetical protein
MAQLPTWRVRVMRKVEDWVDVQATTAQEAETYAYNIPGVLSVFGKSAIRGDMPIEGDTVVGVRED